MRTSHRRTAVVDQDGRIRSVWTAPSGQFVMVGPDLYMHVECRRRVLSRQRAYRRHDRNDPESFYYRERFGPT